jgi:hypothetical protein
MQDAGKQINGKYKFYRNKITRLNIFFKLPKNLLGSFFWPQLLIRSDELEHFCGKEMLHLNGLL